MDEATPKRENPKEKKGRGAEGRRRLMDAGAGATAENFSTRTRREKKILTTTPHTSREREENKRRSKSAAAATGGGGGGHFIRRPANRDDRRSFPFVRISVATQRHFPRSAIDFFLCFPIFASENANKKRFDIASFSRGLGVGSSSASFFLCFGCVLFCLFFFAQFGHVTTAAPTRFAARRGVC